jgi:hypothetical protein
MYFVPVTGAGRGITCSLCGEYAALLRACSGFSRRVKNDSFFAIFHLFSVT